MAEKILSGLSHDTVAALFGSFDANAAIIEEECGVSLFAGAGSIKIAGADEKSVGRAYAALVSEADTLRMLYACYRMKRRDSLLPPLMTRLEVLKNTETQILHGMLSDIRTKETKNETLE